jgi:hypothetical protein
MVGLIGVEVRLDTLVAFGLWTGWQWYNSGPRTRYLLLSFSTSLRILTLTYFDSTQTFHFVLYVLPTRRVEPESWAFSDYAWDRDGRGLGNHVSTALQGDVLPL